MAGYISLLDSCDGEDAEEIMLSGDMDPKVIMSRLDDPDCELSDHYTDDQIDAIFAMLRVEEKKKKVRDLNVN